MAVKWTAELINGIESAIVSGDSIASICGTDVFPHAESTFWLHMAKDEAFRSVIARAMKTRSDRDIEQCRVEAQNATAADWQVAQLRIKTMQWEAGKRRPKEYGERPLPGETPENPLHLKVDREALINELVGDGEASQSAESKS